MQSLQGYCWCRGKRQAKPDEAQGIHCSVEHSDSEPDETENGTSKSKDSPSACFTMGGLLTDIWLVSGCC